ncbi:hypothetical protein [Flavobacterium sp. UBA7680]|uniref:hypothetical protein n=1 Tax=Flavobacterium sp. UBA7680 TaxID=1946559 RepID=UPI0025BB8E01|nr:hypothetical protein [Flavobacterium sp. UBA7680]
MNLLDTNTKIENNLKQIEFYQSLYQKIQSKFSFLIVVYSFIGLYIVEIIKFPFRKFDYTYVIFSIIFIITLAISLYRTYCLVQPENVSYLNEPKYFYNDILNDYQEKLRTDDEEILNEYLKVTYLLELEDVLENNTKVYRKKSNDFYKVFKVLIPTLILYLGLSSFVIIQKKEEQNSISIQNYKEILNYIIEKNMSEDKKPADKKVEKPKIDLKMVIKTAPIVVKESVMLNKHISDSKDKGKKK